MASALLCHVSVWQSDRSSPRMSAAGLLVLATLAMGVQGIDLAGREYTQTQLLAEGALARLVPTTDALIFTKYPHYRLHTLRDGKQEAIVGIPGGYVHDLLMDASGVVWLATRKGLFQYSTTTGDVTDLGITSKGLWRLATAADGTLYAVDASRALHAVSERGLVLVPGVSADCIAFSREGHLFSIVGWGPLYRSEGGAAGPRTSITGLPAAVYTYMLEMDRRDDTLYVCHNGGLYVVLAGSSTAQRLETIASPVFGLGFSSSGDMYIGRRHETIKMTLLPANSSLVHLNVPYKDEALPESSTPAPAELGNKPQVKSSVSGLGVQFRAMRGQLADLARQISECNASCNRQIERVLSCSARERPLGHQQI